MNIKEYLKRSIKFIIKGTPIIYNNCSANIVETSPSELLKGKKYNCYGGEAEDLDTAWLKNLYRRGQMY